MERSRTRSPRILVVSPDPVFEQRMLEILAGEARLDCMSDTDAAMGRLEQERFDGALLDGTLAGRMAVHLAHAFVKHQPMGHAAILSACEDVTTLVAISLRDRRVDLFFPPWDGPSIRRHILAGRQLRQLIRA